MREVIAEIETKQFLSTSDISDFLSFALGSSATTVVRKVEQKIVVNRLIPDRSFLYLPATMQLVRRRGMRIGNAQKVA